MATDSSKFEYGVKDTSTTAVSKGGSRFSFSDRISEISLNPNESSSVGQGSGPNPTHHTRIVKEPTLSITMPVDESVKFKKWFVTNCAADGVCNVELSRKKPRVASVVDLVEDWLPRFGERSFTSGEATMVPIEGNALALREDVTNVLSP